MTTKSYDLTALYVIGSENTAALVEFDHPGMEVPGPEAPTLPFESEMEGMGTAHPDEQMGMPGDMDGLCRWDGALTYTDYDGEIDVTFDGKWERIYSLEALINLTGQGKKNV